MYGEMKAVTVIVQEREKRRETSPILRIWVGKKKLAFDILLGGLGRYILYSTSRIKA
jgi:hypothetical protein